MDVQRLTTLARETLSVAIRQTSAAGNPTVEPIHLLSALLAVACIVGILNLTRIVEFFAFVGAVLDNAI